MYNVLIADDEPYILEGLHYIVDWSALGLQIVGTVSNGEEALQFLENHSVHILLTDILMPVMDGLTLIQKIREKNLDIHCVVLSSYDDYTYLQQALQLKIENYLIKSINESELHDTLMHIVEKLESSRSNADSTNYSLLDNILLRWVSGQISPIELEDRMQFLRRSIGYGTFQVAILRTLAPSSTVAATETSRLLPQVELSPTMHIFKNLNDHCVFIYSSKDPSDLSQIAQSLSSQVSAIYSDPFLLTFSNVVTGASNVPLAYQSAQYLQNYAVTDPSQSTVYYNYPTDESSKIGSLSSSQLEGFYQSLLQGNEAEANAFLSSFFGNTYSLSVYSADFVQTSALRMLYRLEDAMRALYVNASPRETTTNTLYEKVFSAGSRQELQHWVQNGVAHYFTSRKNHQAVDNPILERMLHYIDSHYQEEISLRSISLAFNVNTAYLGRIFKDATGQSFSNYLNMLRIDKAKNLLLQTNSSIQEISSRVGYNSTNYFVNVFKKVTGMFPLQYRSSHLL